MDAVLALDQGGHASRACLVAADGEIIAAHQVPIRTLHGGAGEVEHDPDEIVESLRAAAAQVLASAPEVAIASAALATQRSTIVCFDAQSGRALSRAISWQDRRNAAWLAGFAAHTQRIGEITGLPLSPHYGAGKMRWCLDQLPAVQRARASGTLVMAPLAAYLALRLTGAAPLADPANASRTLLWDSARRDWSDELLQLFGMERRWLPPCAPTRSHYGLLQLAAGAAPRAIALRALTGDQSAIPFALGAPDPMTVYINLGTGAFIQRPVAVRPPSPAPLLASVLYADAERALYSLEGTVNGAGAAVVEFAAASGVPEPQLWQQLEGVASGAPLPLYINGIGGLGSPYWRAQQASYLIGEGSLIERFAAVVESIAFLIAINFDLMRQRAGPLARVIVSGGLSRSDWLCARLAALLGVPVLRGAQEATVLGTAVLAGDDLSGDAGRAHSKPTGEPQFPTGQLAAAAHAALASRRARFEAELRH